MSCVVCGSNNFEELFTLDCGGFDFSHLYRKLIVGFCHKCGHVYNHINNEQIEGIYKYYIGEYSQCNLDSPNKTGDIPGSVNKDSKKRYRDLYNLIKYDIKPDSLILDVGCAAGGFLNFASKYVNINNLYGIDPSEKFVAVAKSLLKEDNIAIGSADHLPYNDNLFNIIVIDQVVEHLIDPNIFLKEAKRVLRKDGILCISVPNAYDYCNCSFFDFYFFLMREHLHHFGPVQLRELVNNHSFSLQTIVFTYPNLISSVGTLPNLTMKFINNPVVGNAEIDDVFQSAIFLNRIAQYVDDSYKKLFERKKEIDNLRHRSSINIYGMSREFHYLWSNTNLSTVPVKLFDDTAAKQKMTIDGRAIFPSDTIEKDSPVLITSYAHIEKMKERLLQQGFIGDFL